MTQPNPFAVSSNLDGTISLLDQKLSGEAVSALVADLLASMIEATEKAGQMARAKQVHRSDPLHAVRPSMIAVLEAPKGHDQRLMVLCGEARLGVIIPMHIVRALGENFLALAAPEEHRH